MNREAFGAETDVFCRMGLISPDGTTIYVHPTFLYESLWNLVCLIFLAVWVKAGKRRYDGQCILIYFFLVRYRPRVDRGSAHRQPVHRQYRYPRITGAVNGACFDIIHSACGQRPQADKPEELYVNRVR